MKCAASSAKKNPYVPPSLLILILILISPPPPSPPVKTPPPDPAPLPPKPLEKAPPRRYQTAIEPALDIERHLRHEPVTARPPARLYQFQKLIRRHKVSFVAGTAVAAALI